MENNQNNSGENIYPPSYLKFNNNFNDTLQKTIKFDEFDFYKYENKFLNSIKFTIGKALKFSFIFIFITIIQFYTWITIPLYFLLQKPWKAKNLDDRYRIKVYKGSNNVEMSAIYERNDPEILDHNFLKFDTVTKMYQSMTKQYGHDRPCFGYRQVLCEQPLFTADGQCKRIDGRKLKQYHLSNYKWLTTGQVEKIITNMAKGLMAEGITEGDKVMIFSETRVEWLLSFISISLSGAIVVTAFSNLGKNNISYSIKQSEVETIIVSLDCIEMLHSVLSTDAHNVKRIIFMEGFKKPKLEFPSAIKILSLNDIEQLGQKCIMNGQDKALFTGKPESLALLMYTSGTTGQPKGVLFSQKQMIGAIRAQYSRVRIYLHETDKHCYVAYLPSAHILELSLELLFFLGGVRIGFASPFTLTDSGPGLGHGQKSDLKLLKPTIMTSVPLVLERIMKEINEKLKARTPVSKEIFTYLAKYKADWTRRGYKCPIVTKLICAKVREQFGNKLEFVICGAAPLNPRTQAFIKAILNVHFIQGYGSTECTGSLICMDFDNLEYGHCGYIMANAYFRLQNWDEGGYSIHDEPNPRGELLLGGDSVALNYYKNKELTYETFYTDENNIRWFRTGDIAELFPNGTMKIIDRRKDLIKLQNGEFISLGKIEAALQTSPMIDNAFVYGDAYSNQLVAIISTNPKAFKEFKKELLQKYSTTRTTIDNELEEQEFYNHILDVCKQCSLKKIEIPTRIKLVDDVWSPDNDLLTASMKLRRQNIMKKYYKELSSLCNGNSIFFNKDNIINA